MQEALEHFFQKSIDESRFSTALFPDWFRSTLNSTICTLDAEFKKVHDLLHSPQSSKETRKLMHATFQDSNSIQEICDGEFVISEEVIDWPSPLGIAVGGLMERLYDSMDFAVFRRLGKTGRARKELYEEFVVKNNYVCPFCSIGMYKNKLGKTREGFDHYLNRSSYPLSSANMKNLVPTCGECNEDYKGAKDILADGAVFYPYAEIPGMKVEVDCLEYPATDGSKSKGKWSVEVALAVPDPSLDSKMAAWDRVYSVKERLINEVTEHFEEWMEELGGEGFESLDEEGLRSLIRAARNKASSACLRRRKPRQIIRAAFYDFMLARAEQTFLLSFTCRLNGGLST